MPNKIAREHNFANLTSNNNICYSDIFDDSYDEELAFTKNTYKHSEGKLSFNYKYALKITDMGEYEENNDDVIVELILVMAPLSFCKAKRESIMCDVFGDDKERTENDLTFEDIATTQMAGVVLMGSSTLHHPTEQQIADVKDDVAAVVDGVDSLRGFYLDRPQNRIGTTGWDLLKEAKGLIKSAIDIKMLSKRYGM